MCLAQRGRRYPITQADGRELGEEGIVWSEASPAIGVGVGGGGGAGEGFQPKIPSPPPPFSGLPRLIPTQAPPPPQGS